MAFIADWFTFGFDPDFDEGVRAFERGNDALAAQSFRYSVKRAAEPAQRDRAIGRLITVLSRAGQKALLNGDAHTAKDVFAEASRLRPQYADLRIGLAWAHFLSGDYKSVAQEAQAALAINGANGQARSLMGLALACLGKPEEGFVAVSEGLESWPSAPGPLLNTLEAWKTGAGEMAVAMARSVRPPAAPSVDAQISTADTAMRERKWELAQAEYRAILAVKPQYADIWAKLGQCLLNTDDYESASVCFQEAIAINEAYAQAWSLYGVALRRSGAEELALSAFRRAVELDAADPVALHELSRRR